MVELHLCQISPISIPARRLGNLVSGTVIKGRADRMEPARPGKEPATSRRNKRPTIVTGQRSGGCRVNGFDHGRFLHGLRPDGPDGAGPPGEGASGFSPL